MANFEDPNSVQGNFQVAAVRPPGEPTKEPKEELHAPPEMTPGPYYNSSEEHGLSSLYDCNGPFETANAVWNLMKTGWAVELNSKPMTQKQIQQAYQRAIREACPKKK